MIRGYEISSSVGSKNAAPDHLTAIELFEAVEKFQHLTVRGATISFTKPEVDDYMVMRFFFVEKEDECCFWVRTVMFEVILVNTILHQHIQRVRSRHCLEQLIAHPSPTITTDLEFFLESIHETLVHYNITIWIATVAVRCRTKAGTPPRPHLLSSFSTPVGVPPKVNQAAAAVSRISFASSTGKYMTPDVLLTFTRAFHPFLLWL